MEFCSLFTGRLGCSEGVSDSFHGAYRISLWIGILVLIKLCYEVRVSKRAGLRSSTIECSTSKFEDVVKSGPEEQPSTIVDESDVGAKNEHIHTFSTHFHKRNDPESPNDVPHEQSGVDGPAAADASKEFPKEALLLDTVEGSPVILHIYDVSQESFFQTLNQVFAHSFSPLKFGGVFHAGVEINGKEWSYGYAPTGSGVCSCRPRQHTQHHYRESIELSPTNLSKAEVARTLADLMGDYKGEDYHLTRRNCCHFAENLSQRLGSGPIPLWTYRLARMGDSILQISEDLEEHFRETRLSHQTAIQKFGADLYSLHA